MTNISDKSYVQNVFVISLPHDLTKGIVDVKAGKSFFCSKFNSCARDDLVDDHSSVYYSSHLSHPIINNDMFLYWGTRDYLISDADAEDIRFTQNLFEYTYLRSSNIIPLSMEEYVKSLFKFKFATKNKQMYVRNQQVYESSKYPVKIFGQSEVEMNACIILVDVSCSAERLHQQFIFLNYFYEMARNTQIKYCSLIVASKCDSCENTRNMKALKKYVVTKNIPLRIVETSSVFNINVQFAYLMLIHKFYRYLNQNTSKFYLKFSKSQYESMDCFYNSIVAKDNLYPHFSSSHSNDKSNKYIINAKLEDEFVEFVSMNFKPVFISVCRDMATLMKDFIEILIKYKTISVSRFNSHCSFEIYSKAIKVFGGSSLKRIHKEIKNEFKNVEKWLCDLYIERLIKVFEVNFPDISSMANFSWNWEGCCKIILNSDVFTELFMDTQHGDRWCSKERLYAFSFIYILRMNSYQFFKISIPKDFLDHPLSQKAFAKHVSKLSNKGKTGKIQLQLEEQLEKLVKDQVFTAGFHLEEVAYYLLFKGYDMLSQKIMESEFFPIYSKHAEKLQDKARENLYELLLEYSYNIDKLSRKNITFEDIKSLVGADERFSSLETRLQRERNYWCINHLASRKTKDSCSYIYSVGSSCIEDVTKKFFTDNKLFTMRNNNLDKNRIINLIILAPNYTWLNLNAVLHEKYSSLCDDCGTVIDTNKKPHIFEYLRNKNNSIVRVPFTVNLIDPSWGEYQMLQKKLYFNNGCIIVYDIGSVNSLYRVDSFIKAFINYVPYKENQSICKLSRIVNVVKVYNSSCNSGMSPTNDISSKLKSEASDDGTNIILRRSLSDCEIGINNFRGSSFQKLLELYNFKPSFLMSDSNPSYEELIENMLDEMMYSIEGFHDAEINLIIYVCIMCGDNIQFESIIRMLVFRRKFLIKTELNEIQLLYKNMNPSVQITMKFTSYHGSYTIDNADGLVAVFSNDRKAEIESVRALLARNPKIPAHLINVTRTSDEVGHIIASNVFQQTQQILRTSFNIAPTNFSSRSLFDSHLMLDGFFDYCLGLKLNCDSLASSKSLSSNMEISKNSNIMQKKEGYKSKGSVSQTDVVWVVNPLAKASARSRIYNTLRGSKVSELKKKSDVINSYGKRNDRSINGKKSSSITETTMPQRPVSDAITYKIKEPMAYKSRLLLMKSEDGEVSVEKSRGENSDSNFLDMISAINVKSRSEKLKSPTPIPVLMKESTVDTINSKRVRTEKKYKTVDRATVSKLLNMLKKKDFKKSNAGISTLSKSKKNSLSDKISAWQDFQNSKTSGALEGCNNRYFGLPISEICTASEPPIFLKKVFAHVESVGLNVEGLYRVSGSKEQIEIFERNFQDDMDMEFTTNTNIHVYTSSAKHFVQMLPKPLFNPEFLHELPNMEDFSSEEEKNAKIREICTKLDSRSYITFTTIMKHLSLIASQAEINKMQPYNLSLCWCPTILRPEMITIGGFTNDFPKFAGFFKDVISRYSQIFE